MSERNNQYENGLTPNKEPIPLILPSVDAVRTRYGDIAARLFAEAETYEAMRDVLKRVRSNMLDSVDDTKDEPPPALGSQPTMEIKHTLLRAVARKSSDEVTRFLEQNKQRYEEDIVKEETRLMEATTTDMDDAVSYHKIAVRALQIHMLDALLINNMLSWKTVKTLVDDDDRCEMMSAAEQEDAFVAYMGVCIERGYTSPASA